MPTLTKKKMGLFVLCASAMVFFTAIVVKHLWKHGDVSHVSSLNFVLKWNKGDVLSYRVNLGSHSDTPMLEKQGDIQSSDMAVDADVWVNVAQVHKTYAVMDVFIHHVHGFSWDILGQAHVNTQASSQVLLNRFARVRIENTGRVLEVRYGEDPSPVFTTVVQTLLQEARFFLMGDATYTQEERTVWGFLNTSYTWDKEASTHQAVLHKKITGMHSYVKKMLEPVSKGLAEGGYDIGFQQGRLDFVKGESVVTLMNTSNQKMFVQKNRIHMRYTGLQKPVSLPVAWENVKGRRMDVGEPVYAQETPQEVLQRRVAGMSEAELITSFSSHASDRNAPDHLDWFWRASGLIKQQQSVGDALVRWYQKEKRTSSETALVLDVLAAADSKASQANMRTVMDMVLSQTPQQAAVALQHMMMITTPTHETAAYVEKHLEDPQPLMRYAAVLTLGAIGRQQLLHGDTDKAAQIVQRFSEQLQHANSAETEILIRALGNTSHPKSVEVVLGYASDEHAGVRKAVASALRNGFSERIQDTLMFLMQDPVSSVQRAALESLQHHQATPHVLQTLAMLLESQSIHPKLFDQLLNGFTFWMKNQPVETEKALLAMLKHAPEETNSRSRAKKLLAQLQETYP
jgi:hypothetical protein